MAGFALHVVGVAGGNLCVVRHVLQDGSHPVGGAEGERVTLVELGVVSVHFGHGQDVYGRVSDASRVRGWADEEWLGTYMPE